MKIHIIIVSTMKDVISSIIAFYQQIMKILIFKTVFLQSQTKRSETNCLNGMQTSWEVIWIHRAKEEFESEEGKEAFEISWN